MNKSITTDSRFDMVKWVISTIMIIGGLLANSYWIEEPLLYRIVGLLIAFAIAVFFLFQTATGKQVWLFAKESRLELRKIVWPTRQETVKASLLVVAMVFLVGLFLWLIDSLLVKIISFVTL